MAEIEITKVSEVKVREIEWLWYPYIPFGYLKDPADHNHLIIDG